MDHMPQIQAVFNKVFDVIGLVASTVAVFIRDEVIPIFQDLWAWFEPHLPMIQELFEQAFERGKEILVELIDIVIEITEWFKEHWAILEPILAGIAAGVIVFELITLAMAAWTTVTTIATGATAAFGAVLA